MSEQPVAPAGGGGKIMGMSRPTFYLVVAGVAVVGGLAYFWWRNYRNAQQAAQAATQTASTTGSSGGSVDYSGELSVIQTELESIMQTLGTQQGTTTGTTGTTTGTGTTTSTPFTYNVPDGSGWWQAWTFPSQSAYDAFLQSLHAHISSTGGQTWPGGLSQSQIAQAAQAVGGTVAGPAGQTGYGIQGFSGPVANPPSFTPV